MQPIKFGVGQAVQRQEDDALLRGGGRFVSDHAPAGLLEAVVLRSPHPHARFRIADTAQARALPGVALVLTGADTGRLGNLPCFGEIPDAKFAIPPYPVLAHEEVRHVGDAVAFVVADSLAHARDAAEAIAIEWEALPHSARVRKAVEVGRQSRTDEKVAQLLRSWRAGGLGSSSATTPTKTGPPYSAKPASSAWRASSRSG